MRERLDSLTGLRFVAAFAVVMDHGGYFTHIPLTEFSAGVSLFFVLSGFVLTWSCASMPAPTFWRRRVARILPIYLVASVIGLLMPFASEGAPTGATWLTSLTLTQAWFPSPNLYFGGDGVAWSLSVEAFFYLLFPVLFGLSRLSSGTRSRLGVGLVLVVALGGLLPASWRWAVYICPLGRLPEFVIGMLAAMAVREGWRPRLLPALVLVSAGLALAFAIYTPERWDYQFALVAGFALLIPALATRDIARLPSVLATPLMVTLGSASYALYLYHRLVFRAVTWARATLAIRAHIEIGWGRQESITLLLAVGASLAVAEVVHRRIELPAQALLLRKRQVRVFAEG